LASTLIETPLQAIQSESRQFADGGTFTTKPYFSGSNDLLKMSDEAKGS